MVAVSGNTKDPIDPNKIIFGSFLFLILLFCIFTPNNDTIYEPTVEDTTYVKPAVQDDVMYNNRYYHFEKK